MLSTSTFGFGVLHGSSTSSSSLPKNALTDTDTDTDTAPVQPDSDSDCVRVVDPVGTVSSTSPEPEPISNPSSHTKNSKFVCLRRKGKFQSHSHSASASASQSQSQVLDPLIDETDETGDGRVRSERPPMMSLDSSLGLGLGFGVGINGLGLGVGNGNGLMSSSSSSLEDIGNFDFDSLSLSLDSPPFHSSSSSSPFHHFQKSSIMATTTTARTDTGMDMDTDTDATSASSVVSQNENRSKNRSVFSVSDVFGQVLAQSNSTAAALDDDDVRAGGTHEGSRRGCFGGGDVVVDTDADLGMIPIDPSRVGSEIEEIEDEDDDDDDETKQNGQDDEEETMSMVLMKENDDEQTDFEKREIEIEFGAVSVSGASSVDDADADDMDESEVHRRSNIDPSMESVSADAHAHTHTGSDSDSDSDPDPDTADVHCATAPRHVFKKALQMESELAEVREACARAESAKAYLELAVDSKDTAIATTRHELGLAMQDLGRVRESLGLKESEVLDLRSHYEALYLMKHPNRIDRVDEVVRLRDELIVMKRELEEKEKEIRVLRICGRRKEASIVRMEERRSEVELCLKNRVEVLEGRIGKASVENSRLKECLANEKRVSEMKMKALGRISRELEQNHTSAEERIADLRKVIDAKDQEIRFLKHQRREEERRLMPNSRLYEESPPQATSRVVRVLEEEHKYLQKKLIVQTDTVEKQKRSLRMLERLTMRLRSRLSDVDLALRDLDLEDYIRRKFLLKARSQVDSSEGEDSEEEVVGEDSENPIVVVSSDNAHVPPQVYLLVKKDAEVLRTKSQSLSTMINEKDAVIESLERHVRVLQKSAASKASFARKKMIAFRRKMERLETENAILEKTAHRLDLHLRQYARRRGSRPTSKKVSRAQRSTRRVPRK